MMVLRSKLLSAVLIAVLVTCCGKNAKHEEQLPGQSLNAEQTSLAAPEPIHVYSNDEVTVNAYNYAGLEYFLRQNNDTTYIVNFWATWCVPCVAELPHFEAVSKKYRTDRVKVLLVSLDMPKMVDDKLLPFIAENKLESNVVLLKDPDANSWIPKIDTTWSGAIPATLIYNKAGRHFYERSFTFEQLDAEVSKLK